MRWYRADFDNDVESVYFEAESDKAAIRVSRAGVTEEYADAPFRHGNLIWLCEVDNSTECFDEIRRVWP